MNAHSPVTAPAFAHLLPADRYSAWRMLGDGTSQPLDLGDATNLADAAQNALLGCQHKDHFVVLHTNAAGKQIEHVYYAKQGKPIFIRKPGFAHQVQARPLVLEHRFSRQLAAFEPVEPWRWTPGADVVGIDRAVVEG